MQTREDWLKKLKEEDFYTYHKTGVFELRVTGTVCAYFVGWRTDFGQSARNIRAGLYFPTKEAAIAWRDNLENARKMLVTEIVQVD